MTNYPVMVQPVFLLLLLGCASGSRVLLLPGPATSHCLEMMAVGEELLRRGHSVTLLSVMFDPERCLSRFNIKEYESKFKIQRFGADPVFQKTYERIMDAALVDIFNRTNLLLFLKEHGQTLLTTTCDALLLDKAAIAELGTDKYDIAVVEALPFTSCMLALPKLLDIDIVALGSFIDPQDSRMPLQANTFPNLFSEFSNEMTFMERVINTLTFLMNPVVKYLILPAVDLSRYDSKLAKYDSRDLVKDAILFLENSDYVIDYPKAVFPNFVQVGALTSNPARPLDANVQKYMDSCKAGVVVVSFGSVLRGIPDYLIDKLMAAFEQLDNPVLFKQDRDLTRGNVKVLKWLPQNDVLAHPNTKLFISHCGKNGFWEGVYHGVPVICMAIHAETHTTKVKVIKYGIGSSIDIFDDTVEELVLTIKSTLGNDTITSNMKRISTLLRDRPETPRQRAASAIEHVIKYGGEHLRPPSVNFGFFSYTNLDVLVVLFVIDLICVLFCVFLIRKCCCGRRAPKRKTE